MRIVITGALGHIGSSLIHNLPIETELVLVDNFYTQRYCSLFDIPSSINYKFIQADILSADLDSIFAGASIVIHLAAITDAETSFNKKELVAQVNVHGTQLVAEACARNHCALIYASTTSIYGVSEGEVDETCTTLKPQSPYAESKLESEQLLSTIQDLSYIILRMGTIFGISPGMRFHTAINKFCLEATLGQPITVWSTALNQNRPYLDIREMTRAINFIIDKKLYFYTDMFNLVTINTTVGDIIDIIKKSTPVSINYVDSPIMNQLSYTVSARKFEKLGFKFKGNLEQGITKTLELL